MWKEAVMTWFDVLFWYFSGVPNETYEEVTSVTVVGVSVMIRNGHLLNTN
jgi:hypothetical protein